MDYCWFEDSRLSEGHIDVTMHVRERMEFRGRSRIRNMNHMVALALLRGKSAEQFRGKERRYLERKSKGDSCAIAYNGYCFIFNKERNVCITVYRLPDWFDFKRIARTKQSVRDWRMARMDDEEYCTGHDKPAVQHRFRPARSWRNDPATDFDMLGVGEA